MYGMKIGSKQAGAAYDRWMDKLADEYWGANEPSDEDEQEETEECE